MLSCIFVFIFLGRRMRNLIYLSFDKVAETSSSYSSFFCELFILFEDISAVIKLLEATKNIFINNDEAC